MLPENNFEFNVTELMLFNERLFHKAFMQTKRKSQRYLTRRTHRDLKAANTNASYLNFHLGPVETYVASN